MKIVLYVEIKSLEYLNKVLKEYNTSNLELSIPKEASFERFEKSAKIILTYDQLTFLTDYNLISL